jgi:hypothetical protein
MVWRIAMAWLVTVPVTIAIAAGLFSDPLQVRTRLPAGAKRIRTAGPTSEPHLRRTVQAGTNASEARRRNPEAWKSFVILRDRCSDPSALTRSLSGGYPSSIPFGL